MTDPTILVLPAVLHRDNRYTIWHAGAVLGPNGQLVFHLDVESAEPENWTAQAPQIPIQALLEAPVMTQYEGMVAGSNGWSAGPHLLRLDARFPTNIYGKYGLPPLAREDLAGASLRIDISPLDLHLTVKLDPQ